MLQLLLPDSLLFLVLFPKVVAGILIKIKVIVPVRSGRKELVTIREAAIQKLQVLDER